MAASSPTVKLMHWLPSDILSMKIINKSPPFLYLLCRVPMYWILIGSGIVAPDMTVSICDEHICLPYTA
jgi:hypothetical protein